MNFILDKSIFFNYVCNLYLIYNSFTLLTMIHKPILQPSDETLSSLSSIFSSTHSLNKFFDTFHNESQCATFLAQVRWGANAICPFCGSIHCFIPPRLNERFACYDCKRRFSVKVGTIFENTKLPLNKWFLAIYLLIYHKKGISSVQLAKDLSITQKTAWHLAQKIRMVFSNVVYDDGINLRGSSSAIYDIPSDIAKMLRNPQDITSYNKMCQHVFLQNERKELREFVNKVNGFSPDTQAIHPGMPSSYILGFWEQFHGMLCGTHHHISKHYFQRYVSEALFRFKTRKLSLLHAFFVFVQRCNVVISYNRLRLVCVHAT